MQEMQFPKILAFVEGRMERLFLNNNFHYVHVVPLDNGSGWTIEKMAHNIASLFRSLDQNPDHIIIWFDRERRELSSIQIRDEIADRLVREGLPGEKLRIGIPDIMTENWILGDESVIQEEFGIEDYQYNHESRSGSHRIKELYSAYKNRSYKKMTDGSRLLKKVRLARSVSNSATAFARQLAMDCWWIGEANAV